MDGSLDGVGKFNAETINCFPGISYNLSSLHVSIAVRLIVTRTHDISSVLTKMRVHLTSFLLLASSAYLVSGRCTNTFQKPEVTVVDSEHLLINWTKSFDGCDSNNVKSTKVHMTASQ